MKIYNGNTLIVDIPLDQDSLRLERACVGFNDILVEYMDKELLYKASTLVLDAVSQIQPDWKIADYENTKTYIYITEDCSGYNFRLSIEVFPPRYSTEYINSILESASNIKSIDDIFSERENWIEIFNSAQQFYENEESGEIWSYKLEPSELEMHELNAIAERLIG